MLDALLRRSAVHLLLIGVVGLLVYSNTFDVPFHFDDRRNIVDNPLVKDFGYYIEPSKAKEHQLYNAFKSRYAGYLSFALNYRAHGLDAAGYHVTNLAVHIINGVLLYLLVRLAFGTPYLRGSPLREREGQIALFSSLLFVAHPVQTQAVTYIVQRFACLATMFYLLSLVLYVKWRLLKEQQSSPLSLYLLSLLSALLAMKTKQIAFTLPLVIALFEFSFFPFSSLPRSTGGMKGGGIKWGRRALYLVPFLLTMFIVPLSVMDMDRPMGEMIGEVPGTEDISRHDYMLTELRVVVTYMRLLALPVGQNLDYDYPIYSSFFEPQVLLSFLFLSGIFVLGVFLFRRSRITDHASRLIAFGIFWFFITLSVESGIIPLNVIFEHRAYLPSAGFFVAVTSAVFLLSKNLNARWMAAALAVMTITFASAAHARNGVWKSNVGLWEDVVRKSPLKARGRYNLGKAYQEKGRVDEALKQYEAAIRLRPDHVDAYNNLGLVYFRRGLAGKAIDLYGIALGLDPGHAELHYNLGIALMSLGRTDEALRHTRRAVVLKPDHYEAHFNLGMLYLEKGLKDKARREFRTTLRINPGYYWARQFLDYTSD